MECTCECFCGSVLLSFYTLRDSWRPGYSSPLSHQGWWDLRVMSMTPVRSAHLTSCSCSNLCCNVMRVATARVLLLRRMVLYTANAARHRAQAFAVSRCIRGGMGSAVRWNAGRCGLWVARGSVKTASGESFTVQVDRDTGQRLHVSLEETHKPRNS